MTQVDSVAKVDGKAERRKYVPNRINKAVSSLGLDSYLEVGVATGGTFFDVECERKIAVDPEFRFDPKSRDDHRETYWTMTSDDYFDSVGSDESLGFVFLDGLHTYHQTLRDLMNALDRTSGQSLILLDDTLPNDPFSTIPDQMLAVRSRRRYGVNPASRAWHGDVFKVAVFLHDYLPHLEYGTIVGSGNPQTLVWREEASRRRRVTADPGQIDGLDFYWLQNNLGVLQTGSDDDVMGRALRAVGS